MTPRRLLVVGVLVCSVLIGGGYVAVAADGSASATNVETTPGLPDDRTASLEASDPLPDEASPETLEGDVTTPPIDAGDRLLVGTDRGLYVFSDGDLETFLETGSVETVTHLEGDRAIVLVEDEYFPNVLAVDLAAGEVQWSDSHERETYSNDLGYVDRQVPAFDAEPIGDGDVAVSAGNAVIALDGASGERLWTVERDHTVWELAAANDRLYAGTQGGSLVAIDADDGEHVYDRQVADPFEHDVGEIPRSVWSVETVAGGDRVAVTTEDGQVAALEAGDGTIAWQERVVEFDDGDLEQYYRSGDRSGTPTLPGDSHYFNLELTALEDGGETKLAVTAAVQERATVRGYPDEVSELHLVDASSGTVEWSKNGITLERVGNVEYSPDVAGGGLLVPDVPGEGSQDITVLDIGDGTESEVLEVPAVSGAEPVHRGPPGDAVGYVTTAGTDLAVASTEGDLAVVDGTGEIEWSVPSVRDAEVMTADFLGDGVEDHLLVSQNAVEWRTQTRSLLLRSGADGSVVWSNHVNVEAFHEHGGLENVQPVERGDDLDVLALQRPVDPDGPDEAGAVVVISGDDGELLHRYELVDDRGDPIPITVAESVGDVTGNGNQDVIVGERDGVNVLDLEAGEIVWEREYQQRGPDSEEWRPIDANDIQYRSVGEDTIVAFSRGAGEIAVLEADRSDGELAFETVRRAEYEGVLSTDDVRRLGDRTGDGYEELLFEVRDDDRQLEIFAPGEGELVTAVADANQVEVEPTDSDFTGDGSLGTVFFETGGDNEVTVYDGLEPVWSDEMDHPPATARMPAAPAGDVTGDGNEELAVVETSHERGAWVDVYDVTEDQLVDRITLEREADDAHSDPGPGIFAQRIPDRTGDGQPELGVVTATEGGSGEDVRFYVVDPTDGEVVLSGDGEKRHFVALEDDLGIVTADGGLQAVDPDDGVTLEATDDGSDVGLEWAVDGDHVTTVLVNDRPVEFTREDTAELRLPEGTHEITIETTRENGITVYDTVTVTVEEESSMDLVLYAATGLSVAALFAIGLVPRALRRVRGQ